MILDTNALSALSEADARVLQYLDAESQMLLPVVVVGEYRYGLLGSRKKGELSAWLDVLCQQVAVIDVSVETAVHYADIRFCLRQQGTPIPLNDVWIAALARQYGHAVLSNDQHFDCVPGVKRVAWA